jgi:hypothetical protein
MRVRLAEDARLEIKRPIGGAEQERIVVPDRAGDGECRVCLREPLNRRSGCRLGKGGEGLGMDVRPLGELAADPAAPRKGQLGLVNAPSLTRPVIPLAAGMIVAEEVFMSRCTICLDSLPFSRNAARNLRLDRKPFSHLLQL